MGSNPPRRRTSQSFVAGSTQPPTSMEADDQGLEFSPPADAAPGMDDGDEEALQADSPGMEDDQEGSQSPGSPGTMRDSAGEQSAVPRSQRQRLTEEEKRQNHVRSERKRRAGIRNQFDELCLLVPGAEGLARSEGPALERIYEHIRDQLRWRREMIDALQARGQEVPPNLMEEAYEVLERVEELEALRAVGKLPAGFEEDDKPTRARRGASRAKKNPAQTKQPSKKSKGKSKAAQAQQQQQQYADGDRDGDENTGEAEQTGMHMDVYAPDEITPAVNPAEQVVAASPVGVVDPMIT